MIGIIFCGMEIIRRQKYLLFINERKNNWRSFSIKQLIISLKILLLFPIDILCRKKKSGYVVHNTFCLCRDKNDCEIY